MTRHSRTAPDPESWDYRSVNSRNDRLVGVAAGLRCGDAHTPTCGLLCLSVSNPLPTCHCLSLPVVLGRLSPRLILHRARLISVRICCYHRFASSLALFDACEWLPNVAANGIRAMFPETIRLVQMLLSSFLSCVWYKYYLRHHPSLERYTQLYIHICGPKNTLPPTEVYLSLTHSCHHVSVGRNIYRRVHLQLGSFFTLQLS